MRSIRSSVPFTKPTEILRSSPPSMANCRMPSTKYTIRFVQSKKPFRTFNVCGVRCLIDVCFLFRRCVPWCVHAQSSGWEVGIIDLNVLLDLSVPCVAQFVLADDFCPPLKNVSGLYLHFPLGFPLLPLCGLACAVWMFFW